MTERVDHGPSGDFINILVKGTLRHSHVCICGETPASARTSTGATFKLYSHALNSTRRQYIEALDLLTKIAAKMDGGVTEVSHSAIPSPGPGDMVTIAMHPALMTGFNEWLDGRQLEMSPPIKIGDDDQFHVIQPQQHVWSSLASNPRDAA